MGTLKKSTLVNLAVVLVIVVVVAAFALPAWRSHNARKHVETALSATAAAKLVVMEAAMMRGSLDKVTPADLEHNTGQDNRYVERITVGDGGQITLTTRNTGADPDPVLVLVPAEPAGGGISSSIQWSCVLIKGSALAAPKHCSGSPETLAAPAPGPAAAESVPSPTADAGA